MLPEKPDHRRGEEAQGGWQPGRDDQPEYVGAPTEYADEAEVPEAIGLIAKILAGGLLAWSTAVVVLVVAGVTCAICAVLYFLAGSAL